jgi:phosphohistidine phosphatase
MKTLFVLRHGHAATETGGASDHERELTPRGASEVERAAQRLVSRGNLPSSILSSTARRARQTAELCASAFGAAPELHLLDELYLAPPPSYLAALAGLGGEHASVMVVGHNPGLEALIYWLTERSEHLATASLVEVELDIDAWDALAGHSRGLGRIMPKARA